MIVFTGIKQKWAGSLVLHPDKPGMVDRSVFLNVLPEIQGDGIVTHQEFSRPGQMVMGFGIVRKQTFLRIFGTGIDFMDFTKWANRTFSYADTYLL